MNCCGSCNINTQEPNNKQNYNIKEVKARKLYEQRQERIEQSNIRPKVKQFQKNELKI